MTSAVKMTQDGDYYTMAFSMPPTSTLHNLPEPLDKRVEFEEVDTRIVASHEFSWLSSQNKNDKKAAELREWIKKYPYY